MFDLFADGGLTMYPTASFGSLTVLAALLIAFKPEVRFTPLLLAAGALTTISGLLGVAMGLTGLLKASVNAPTPDRAELMVACSGQAFSNIAFSLVFLMISVLVASTGAVRVAFGRSVVTI